MEFAGPDSSLLLDRGGELLRSFELLASEVLHLQGNEHEKIWFDCKNFRALRIDDWIWSVLRSASPRAAITASVSMTSSMSLLTTRAEVRATQRKNPRENPAVSV